MRVDMDKIGMEVGREGSSCQQHGAFDTIGRYHINQSIIWSTCPECLVIDRQKNIEPTTSAFKQRLINAGISKRFLTSSLRTYVPDNASQEKALKAFNRFGSTFSKRLNSGMGIVISGDTGVGKTHLACSLIHGLLIDGYTAKLINAIDMIQDVRSAYGNKALSESDITKKYATYDLLIIDEIGVQLKTDSELLVLYNVINKRYENRLPTIIISNLHQKALSDFITPRIYRRVISGGMQLSIEGGNYES